MKTKDARALARSLLVDIDGVIAGDPRDEAARHSAAASAAVLSARLIAGMAVNLARIAYACERIADNMEPEEDDENAQ